MANNTIRHPVILSCEKEGGKCVPIWTEIETGRKETSSSKVFVIINRIVESAT